MEANMAVPVHIVLIDTTGTIRLSRMKKVAAAIEHQVKHDLGKFYDVEARITALRHGGSFPTRPGRCTSCRTCMAAAVFIPTRMARHSPRSASARIGRCR